MGFVLLTRSSLPGGRPGLPVAYAQFIAARLGALCAWKCNRCDRRIRASFRAGPSDWSGHRKTNQDKNIKDTHALRLYYNNTTNMPAFRLEALAYPGVVSLVSFLAFTSQWLFYNIQPGPLRKGEAYIFNALVFALLVCYTRTCYTDPGRIPSDWHEKIQTKDECARVAAEASSRQRYCRKCEMPKPPRAHHCKVCKR
jgi:hypothetical protein